MFKETNRRSIAKGVSWRVVATTTTILIVYFFFDRLDLAIAVGMIETVLKVGLYWAHERAWFKVQWGRKKSGIVMLSLGQFQTVLMAVPTLTLIHS